MHTPMAMTTMFVGHSPMQDRRIPTKMMTVAADDNGYEDFITSHHHALPVHSWGHWHGHVYNYTDNEEDGGMPPMHTRATCKAMYHAGPSILPPPSVHVHPYPPPHSPSVLSRPLTEGDTEPLHHPYGPPSQYAAGHSYHGNDDNVVVGHSRTHDHRIPNKTTTTTVGSRLQQLEGHDNGRDCANVTATTTTRLTTTTTARLTTTTTARLVTDGAADNNDGATDNNW
ncbi:hypothetical protein EDB85DRAFT_2257391 [Lactarius pseudohatsudake]|nr:hypothetical protein EDB85DRAFT_2257391 [Lactarius pseudohatsudake]